MRLINRKEFLAIDKKVVFSYWDEEGLYGAANIKMYIKLENIGTNNFYVQDVLNHSIKIDGIDELYPMYKKAERILNIGGDIELKPTSLQKELIYEDKQRFLVFTDKDVQNIIYTLSETIN